MGRGATLRESRTRKEPPIYRKSATCRSFRTLKCLFDDLHADD